MYNTCFCVEIHFRMHTKILYDAASYKTCKKHLHGVEVFLNIKKLSNDININAEYLTK